MSVLPKTSTNYSLTYYKKQTYDIVLSAWYEGHNWKPSIQFKLGASGVLGTIYTLNIDMVDLPVSGLRGNLSGRVTIIGDILCQSPCDWCSWSPSQVITYRTNTGGLEKEKCCGGGGWGRRGRQDRQYRQSTNTIDTGGNFKSKNSGLHYNSGAQQRDIPL